MTSSVISLHKQTVPTSEQHWTSLCEPSERGRSRSVPAGRSHAVFPGQAVFVPLGSRGVPPRRESGRAGVGVTTPCRPTHPAPVGRDHLIRRHQRARRSFNFAVKMNFICSPPGNSAGYKGKHIWKPCEHRTSLNARLFPATIIHTQIRFLRRIHDPVGMNTPAVGPHVGRIQLGSVLPTSDPQSSWYAGPPSLVQHFTSPPVPPLYTGRGNKGPASSLAKCRLARQKRGL